MVTRIRFYVLEKQTNKQIIKKKAHRNAHQGPANLVNRKTIKEIKQR